MIPPKGRIRRRVDDVEGNMQTRLAAKGDLDVATVPELKRRLYEAIESDPGGRVTVDLTELTFVDSTGLGVLVGALKKARLCGGELFFTRPPDSLWKVFTVTGLDRALPFETVDETQLAATS